MKRNLTIECAVVFTIPFDEAGAKQLKNDGIWQTELELERGVRELFANDGVQVVTVACDIVSPFDIFME